MSEQEEKAGRGLSLPIIATLIISLLAIAAVVIVASGGSDVSEREPTGESFEPTEEISEAIGTEEGTPGITEMATDTSGAGEEEETPAPEETAVSETPFPTATAIVLPEMEGALISVQMDSKVGVLLNSFHESIRDRVAQSLIDAPDDYWEGLALRQVQYTTHRLNFRNFIYPGKGQLPLPPRPLWSFELGPEGPVVEVIGDLEFVVLDYTFNSTLLTDVDSPFQAEPALGEEGGV